MTEDEKYRIISKFITSLKGNQGQNIAHSNTELEQEKIE